MRQWGRWCMHEDYLGVDVPHAAERFASVTTPMTVLSFTDDELMSEASIADLHDRFVQRRPGPPALQPRPARGRRMGHHGFFRARHQDLWDELVLPYLAVERSRSPRRSGVQVAEVLVGAVETGSTWNVAWRTSKWVATHSQSRSRMPPTPCSASASSVTVTWAERLGMPLVMVQACRSCTSMTPGIAAT